MIEVKVKKLREGAELPFVATTGAVGADLRACLYDEETGEKLAKIVIPAGGKAKINTGLAFQLPENYFMMLAPRSSMGIKKGLMLQNTIGILDADFEHECLMFLKNVSDEPVEIEFGERIAQAIVLPYPPVNYSLVEEFDKRETNRIYGFGSSGKF